MSENTVGYDILYCFLMVMNYRCGVLVRWVPLDLALWADGADDRKWSLQRSGRAGVLISLRQWHHEHGAGQQTFTIRLWERKTITNRKFFYVTNWNCGTDNVFTVPLLLICCWGNSCTFKQSFSQLSKTKDFLTFLAGAPICCKSSKNIKPR